MCVSTVCYEKLSKSYSHMVQHNIAQFRPDPVVAVAAAHIPVTKMESKNCKRLKRDEDDGVSAGFEGNFAACLVVPLLEEQIPGIETCSYEVFEFRAGCSLS